MTTLTEYLERLGLALDRDYLRAALQTTVQLAMDIEVSLQLEAGHYERSEKRNAYRNGYRERFWETTVGEILIRIPKLRRGSYYPAFMSSPEQVEQRLLDFSEQVFTHGARLEDVASLLAALDIPPMHRSLIADMCARLDDLAWNFREKPLDGTFPYVWLDLLILPTGERLMVAIGVAASGELALLGCEIGTNWRSFLKQLYARGLRRVRLVISDDYGSLRDVAEEVFIDARWQYCRAYALGDILRYVPMQDRADVVIAISTIFIQTGHEAAAHQLERVIETLKPRLPQAAAQLGAVGDDLLAYFLRSAVHPVAAPARTGAFELFQPRAILQQFVTSVHS